MWFIRTVTVASLIMMFICGSESTQCGIRNINGIGTTVDLQQPFIDIRSSIKLGDEDTLPGEFPWMVAVLTHDNEYAGAGSLVHPRVVLASGIKMHDKTKAGSSLIARIGDWNLVTSSESFSHQSINVKKVLFHPHFDRPTFVSNVALLILERDAVLSGSVMPVCLPEPAQNFDGAQCIVSGWGKDVLTRTDGNQKILKRASVPIVKNSDCERTLRNTDLGSSFNLDRTFSCAGGQGAGICPTDGGAPLVCPKPNNPNQYVQVGLVTFNIGCNKIGNPEVFSSIPQTVDWISEILQKEVGSPRQKPITTTPQPGSCGNTFSAEIGDRIINGSPTVSGQYPWMVRLSFHSEFHKRPVACGATLISRRWVLTAAHCMSFLKQHLTATAQIGFTDRSRQNSGSKLYQIHPNDIKTHEEYVETTLENDIALIYLPEEVPLSKEIQIICLATDDLIPFGETAIAAGWGLRSSSENKGAIILQDVVLDVLTDGASNCRNSQHFICTFTTGKDTCAGDSGGPLMVQHGNRWYQIGIISSGPIDCGINNTPGTYTRVPKHLTWIARNTRF